jgi:predicted aminopeptidase
LVSLRILLFGLVGCFALCSCQVGYLLNNAYHQGRILKRAVPIDDVLQNETVNADVKKKLILAQEAKKFAEDFLKLKKTKNYSTYVQLDGPYVTYVVSAAPKNELTYYTWWFPIVGSVPYKGYFKPEPANDLAKELQAQNYDTYVRGVSAFSTLGWFRDPVLSSMINYQDIDLVNTIIHETVHATLYISGNANFNERLATYLGDLGTRLFYQQKGEELYKQVAQTIQDDEFDQKVFTEFISEEIKKLEQWYQVHKNDADLLASREVQFAAMKQNFVKAAKGQLKTKRYANFDKSEINNARLLGFKLYLNDLSDFQKLNDHFKADFVKILDYCKSLENEKDPEASLKNFTKSIKL